MSPGGLPKRWLAAVAGLAMLAVAATAQQTIRTPVLMDESATRMADQRQDDRVDHRPLAQEDKTLKMGRESKQGDAVVAIQAPRQDESADGRVRARALLEEDRSRVKREAALDDE